MSTTTAAPSRTSTKPRPAADHAGTSYADPGTRRTGGGRTGRRTPYTSPVRRPGSRQQLTVRGRRVTGRNPRDRSVVWTWVVLVALFVAGVTMAMYPSGRTTEQSFELSEARETSTTLSNEIESLNRDVEHASSTQNLAAEATRMGMVVPGQTGVLNVDGENVDEVRPADSAEGTPLTDVNGDVRSQGPTSDPDDTSQVPGLAPQALEDRDAAGQDAEGREAPDGQAAPQAPAAPTGDLPYAP